MVNNAGIAPYDDLSDRATLERHLAVNLFGTDGVTQAFLPLRTRSKGAIVNNVSTMAFALLAGRGMRVHAALTGPTDTDMTDLDSAQQRDEGGKRR